MAKLYGNPIPHPDKPHVAFALLEKDSGERVEVPVRIAHYNSLTAAKKLAYTLECAEHHSSDGPGWHAKRATRRALWDADDKAKADAAALAAKVAEEAKFIVTPQGFVKDKEGALIGVKVTVTHHGLTMQSVIPTDPAIAEASARAAFAEYEAKVLAEKQALDAFKVG